MGLFKKKVIKDIEGYGGVWGHLVTEHRMQKPSPRR